MLTEREKWLMYQSLFWEIDFESEATSYSQWLLESESRLADEAPDNWIPVSERLPDGEATVLIVDTLGLVSVGTYIDKDEFFDFIGDVQYVPTHWMFLPSPPTDSATWEDE